MASPENLCQTCIDRGQGICLFEDAIKKLKPKDLTETIISEHTIFATEVNCVKIDAVRSIARILKDKVSKRKPQTGIKG